MIRSFKFPLRPTRRQAATLSAMLADHRSLDNAALQGRREAYAHPSRTRIRYTMQATRLSDIRALEPHGQARWSYSCQQATLRRLDKAFQAFFRRIKAGHKPGYPRFKGAGRFHTVVFPKNGDGCRWDSTPHDPQPRVRLQGVGHVTAHQHRPAKGRVKTISVTREATRWYVVLACAEIPAAPLPATGVGVGIDTGLASFVTTSDGRYLPNPRHRKAAQEKLTYAQRELARFPRRRAANRTRKHQRAADRGTRLHRTLARERLDHAHKTALALVRNYDLIAHEDLRITNLLATPTAKPDPDRAGAFLPNGARAKAGLNSSISDAGWGVFLGILAPKAEWAGRGVIPVHPRNTSRGCPECGHTARENRATQAAFRCLACGFAEHADVVGATNVLRAGLALREAAQAA